ncbi:MAG: GNAT family N-acetyltransferase [Candidatus Micrarchaeota archaeon]
MTMTEERTCCFLSDKRIPLAARKHALTWMRKTDVGSKAEREIKPLLELPVEERIQAALKAGHDGYFVLDDAGKVVNHAFFQINGNELHVYSVHTAKEHARRGLATRTARELIELVPKKFPGVRLLFLGGGGDPRVASIARGLKTRPHSLSIKSREDIGSSCFELLR